MSDSAVATHRSADAQAVARRRLPIGAEWQGDGHTHFRVWAPAARDVAVKIGNAFAPLEADDEQYFAGFVDAKPGDRYQFRLDGGDQLYPDPASRHQPQGPHGPSEIIDPGAFRWNDASWPGIGAKGQVLYEVHVGTFTPEGTFAAATLKLPELAALGITTIELMPLADFAGAFGWGYDGVDMFAPAHQYGTPDDLRRFVDAAHANRLGVILDVVYNHLGPVGNYLRAFSPSYFTNRYTNEWGDAINFDGPDAQPVREFFLSNAGYWIDEFHFDGLRLDATQQIFDSSPEHIIRQVTARARQASGARSILVVAENEPQDTNLVRSRDEGGYGVDAVWNDDFHHSAMVALTGHREAYYSDTNGTPQEFVSAAKYGYLFQGQHYHWQRSGRGTPSWGLPAEAFVAYLQNHDQVANSARGLRAHELTSPGRWRAMTALLLLGPSTPMLFQGQEFASSAPFLYFADHEKDIANAVRIGRREFLAQFPSVEDYVRTAALDDPGDRGTFERCKIDWAERDRHAALYALHVDLLRLRREDPVLRERGGIDGFGIDGCVLSACAFALRFFSPGHADDRLLIVNLGRDLIQNSFAEPLIAPPRDRDWEVAWSSELPAYGGFGHGELWVHGCWRIPGEAAVLLTPRSPRERAAGRMRRTA